VADRRTENMDSEKQFQAIQQLINMNLELSNEQFIEYIKQGNVEIVRLFLTAGINPNVKVPIGFAKVIEEIIHDLPFYINEYSMPEELTDETEKNVTPLHWAAAFNQLEICRILLESGADIYARETYKVTALDIACAIGSLELVKLLIENGAEVGLEPLDWAVRQGHLDMVKELIAHGANIRERGKDNTTVLSTTIYRSRLDIAKYLIDLGLDIHDEWNSLGETLLTTAVRSWDPETVKFVIEQGADVNERDRESGKTALFSAAWRGDTETAKVLVEYGTNLDIRDDKGQTVLDYALENKKERFVRFLKSVRAKEKI
jgi:ankyrin repeat protein